ncbi:cation-transporting P-type ATPase [Patescibacteria group bacterium]|nr:cation-transporting P-type ATPase [Patescibacteria group bacterium]
MQTITAWHSITTKEALRILNSNAELGLKEKEVELRKSEYGLNTLPEDKPLSPLVLFLRQFKSPLIFILVIAGSVTFWLQEYTDSIVIFSAVLLNTAIGYFQENKASKALFELKKILQQKALVVREGTEREILQEDLVPGDLIVLTEGNKVPADCRILESFELRINEAVLTGEWLASEKKPMVLERKTPLADRDNMAYMGSVVAAGKGKALVIATAQRTELGRISKLISEVKEEKTPYQKKLQRFSWIIGTIIAFLTVFIFVEGVATGGDIVEMFTIAVAIAVAAIPEGLPVAMTVVLAVGMQRILAKKGLVRHLTSAETLGSTSIIVTDKTLTLTEGRMKVEEVVPLKAGNREEVLRAAALANEAFIENPKAALEKPVLRGRPTDKALLQAAMEAGISRQKIEEHAPCLFRIPFNSNEKYLASFHKDKEAVKLYVSGAPERIMELSKLSEGEVHQAEKRLQELTSQGLRVVALAKKDILNHQGPMVKKEMLRKEIVGLEFLGFIALKDPIRKGVKEAIKLAKDAGLKTIIATGDHLLTAKAVAMELKIPANEENLMEGKELDGLTDNELDSRLGHIFVFARVEPKHKLRIIEAWQRRGQVVAMTGDGVNDAPALKKADIGLALGSGTDVAKEASDLILLADNFAIIPAAIKEGRVIIDNIRKVITYLVSGSFTETILIGTSLLLGLPLPLTALQILWINLVEDGLPGMALTLEKPEGDVMARPPLKKNSSLLTQEMKVIIFGISIITDVLLFGLFLWLLQTPYTIQHIQTVIFVGLGIDSLFYVFSVRSLRRNIWQYNPFSNLWVTGAVFLGLLLLVSAVYLPLLQFFLGTVALTLFDWTLLISLGLLNVLLIEAVKWYYIRKMK